MSVMNSNPCFNYQVKIKTDMDRGLSEVAKDQRSFVRKLAEALGLCAPKPADLSRIAVQEAVTQKFLAIYNAEKDKRDFSRKDFETQVQNVLKIHLGNKKEYSSTLERVLKAIESQVSLDVEILEGDGPKLYRSFVEAGREYLSKVLREDDFSQGKLQQDRNESWRMVTENLKRTTGAQLSNEQLDTVKENFMEKMNSLDEYLHIRNTPELRNRFISVTNPKFLLACKDRKNNE